MKPVIFADAIRLEDNRELAKIKQKEAEVRRQKQEALVGKTARRRINQTSCQFSTTRIGISNLAW